MDFLNDDSRGFAVVFLYHKHFDTGEQNYASYTQGDPRQTLSFQNAFSGNDNFSLF